MEDEVVFVKKWGTHELVYYSEQLPYQQYTFKQAKDKLKELNQDKGLYIYSDVVKLKSAIRINTKGGSTVVESY